MTSLKLSRVAQAIALLVLTAAATQMPSASARAEKPDTYEEAVAKAYKDITIIPPVCRLGADLVKMPAGMNDARMPLTVVTKNPSEMLSRYHEPEDLQNITYDYSSPEQVGFLQTDKVFERMRPEAMKAVESMITAARSQGIILTVHSAFRPYVFQCIVFNKKMKKEFEADPSLRSGELSSEQLVVAKVNTRSALPGASEHQLGTAVDLSTDIKNIAGEPIDLHYKLEPEMDQTPAFAWLRQNAFRFGFVLSYPKGTGDIKAPNPKTGYVYEPWHWRYVGITTATTYRTCDAIGMTTQEFLRRLKVNPKFNCTKSKP